MTCAHGVTQAHLRWPNSVPHPFPYMRRVRKSIGCEKNPIRVTSREGKKLASCVLAANCKWGFDAKNGLKCATARWLTVNCSCDSLRKNYSGDANGEAPCTLFHSCHMLPALPSLQPPSIGNGRHPTGARVSVHRTKNWLFCGWCYPQMIFFRVSSSLSIESSIFELPF